MRQCFKKRFAEEFKLSGKNLTRVTMGKTVTPLLTIADHHAADLTLRPEMLLQK